MRKIKLLIFALLMTAALVANAGQESVGQIVFVSGQDFFTQLYLINGDGSGLRQLTDDKRKNRDPVWSPDGTEIAYTSFEVDENGSVVNSEIRVVSVESGEQRILTETLQTEGWAAFDTSWSADGNWIAFSVHDAAHIGDAFNTSQIYRVHTSTLELLPVTDYPEGTVGCYLPQWLPDGYHIIMYCRSLMQGGILIGNIESTDLDMLVEWQGARTFISNLDGQYIAYAEDFLWGIVDTQDLTNRTVVYLRVDETRDVAILSLAWSPLNPSQFIVLTPEGLYLGQFGADNRESLEFEPLYSDRNTEALYDMATGELNWSSNGANLVFTAEIEGTQQLFTVRADGRELTRLTHSDMSNSQPRWRPQSAVDD